MTYTFEIATTDEDRQACRALAVTHNGHGFCPADAPPEVLVNALDSFRPNELTWIAGRDESGEIVAAECIAVGHMPGGAHLSVVSVIRPDVLTEELARTLLAAITLAFGPEDSDHWVAIMGADSPLLDTVLDVYGGDKYVTVTPYEGDRRMDLVRLEGVLVNRRAPGLTK